LERGADKTGRATKKRSEEANQGHECCFQQGAGTIPCSALTCLRKAGGQEMRDPKMAIQKIQGSGTIPQGRGVMALLRKGNAIPELSAHESGGLCEKQSLDDHT